MGICGQGPSDHPDLARWLLDQGIESMSLNDFVDFLFMSALQRKPSATEKTDLTAVYESPAGTSSHLATDTNGDTVIRSGRHDDIARITFDYITRLPEFYYFRAVN